MSKLLETGRKKPTVEADFLCSNEESLVRRRENGRRILFNEQ
jgi:hypothetical protein